MNWIETDVTDFHGFKNRLRSGKARGQIQEWMEGAGTEGTCFLLGGGGGGNHGQRSGGTTGRCF